MAMNPCVQLHVLSAGMWSLSILARLRFAIDVRSVVSRWKWPSLRTAECSPGIGRRALS
jgi:hypothetical protein